MYASAVSDRTWTQTVFEADASVEQRELYRTVCDDLDASPIAEDPLPLVERVTMSCRCSKADRRKMVQLAREMGITQNALLLTAARMGIQGIREARSERLNG